MKIPLMKHIAICLSLVMFIISIAPRLDAGMAPSSIIAISQFERDADIEKIQRALEGKVVKDRLEKLGFTTDEINTRLDKLSDQQIHQLANQLDDLRVGGQTEIIIVILVILLAVIGVYFMWKITERTR